jgi:hypothetical protein
MPFERRKEVVWSRSAVAADGSPSIQKSRWLEPILDSQPLDSPEMANIARDHGAAVMHSCGGNEDIFDADHPPCSLKLREYVARDHGLLVAQGHNGTLREFPL